MRISQNDVPFRKDYNTHFTDSAYLKFIFVDGRGSSKEKRKIEPVHIDWGLYLNIVDIVVAMINKI